MTLTDSGARQLATGIICGVIGIVATALRFWCKRTMRNGIHADDWWMLATLLLSWGAEAAVIWGLFAGSEGKEIEQITDELMASPSTEKLNQLYNYLESLFIGITIAYVTLFCAKISICLMYRRMFPLRQYQIVANVLMVLATLWFIGTFVANMCICIPVDSFWHRLEPGRCLDFNLFFLVNGIIEILIDAAILILPIWVVQTLHMPLKTKVLVMGIFLLGGFTIVTNILRIYYSYQPNQVYVSFTKAQLWLEVHVAVIIICGSAPIYSPVRTAAGWLVTKLRDRYGSSLRFLSFSSRWKLSGKTGESEGSDFKMSRQTPKSGSRDFYKQSGDQSSGYSDKDLILSPRGDNEYSVSVGQSGVLQGGMGLAPRDLQVPIGVAIV